MGSVHERKWEIMQNISIPAATGVMNAVATQWVTPGLKVIRGSEWGVGYSLFIKILAHYSSH